MSFRKAVISALAGLEILLGGASLKAESGKNSNFFAPEKKYETLQAEYSFEEPHPLMEVLENDWKNVKFDEEKQTYFVNWDLKDTEQLAEAIRCDISDSEKNRELENRMFFYAIHQTADRDGRMKFVWKEYDSENLKLFPVPFEMYDKQNPEAESSREYFLKRERGLFGKGIPKEFMQRWKSLGEFLDNHYHGAESDDTFYANAHPNLKEAILDLSKKENKFVREVDPCDFDFSEIPTEARDFVMQEIEYMNSLRDSNVVFVPYQTDSRILHELISGKGKKSIVYAWNGDKKEMEYFSSVAAVNPDVQFIALEPSKIHIGYSREGIHQRVQLDGGRYDTFCYTDGELIRRVIGIRYPLFYSEKKYNAREPEKNILSRHIFEKVPEPEYAKK